MNTETDTVITPEQQLEHIRRRRKELEQARAKRAEPTVAELLAVEERELHADEAFEKAQLELGHKRVEIVRSEAGSVVIKRPMLAVYRRYQDEGEANHKTLRKLVEPCVVHPSLAEFDQMLEQLPHLLNRVADAVARLAGVTREEIAKK